MTDWITQKEVSTLAAQLPNLVASARVLYDNRDLHQVLLLTSILWNTSSIINMDAMWVNALRKIKAKKD